MRPVTQLVHSRTRLGRRYALFPLEGYPYSRLPSFPTAQVRVLSSPALGAGFVQYWIDLPTGESGQFGSKGGVETFYYVMGGDGGTVTVQYTSAVSLWPGSFGLVPPGATVTFAAGPGGPLSLLLLRKRYETYELPDNLGVPFGPVIHSHLSDVPALPWDSNEHSRLQTLIPDDFGYDLAMNIFTFDPGHGLPIVETHVMEHGALILQGKGLYYLDGDWMEVERDDFIWMGPFCPQSFYATGPTPAKYIYYKNVNREIPL